MAVFHHLHRELLKDFVDLIQSSPSTITFYKVKSHFGIIIAMKVQCHGNKGADHLAHKAASVIILTFPSRQLLTPSTTCSG
jgi:hypothetical protein